MAYIAEINAYVQYTMSKFLIPLHKAIKLKLEKKAYIYNQISHL